MTVIKQSVCGMSLVLLLCSRVEKQVLQRDQTSDVTSRGEAEFLL